MESILFLALKLSRILNINKYIIDKETECIFGLRIFCNDGDMGTLNDWLDFIYE